MSAVARWQTPDGLGLSAGLQSFSFLGIGNLYSGLTGLIGFDPVAGYELTPVERGLAMAAAALPVMPSAGILARIGERLGSLGERAMDLFRSGRRAVDELSSGVSRLARGIRDVRGEETLARAGSRLDNVGHAGSTATRSARATERERTVVIGRNMDGRVIPYAEKNGYDWYKGTPKWVPRGTLERISPRALEKTDLWFNKHWIRGEMHTGSRVIDIGQPSGYRPSTFYDMEGQQVSRSWNYFQDPQP